MTALHHAALDTTEPTDFDHEALVNFVAFYILEQELEVWSNFGIFSKILQAISSIFKYSPIAYSSKARIAVYLTQQDMERRHERS